jgi:DNA-binding CsgD family transcriptional regulator
MIESITINAGKDFLEERRLLEEMEGDHLLELVSDLQKCKKQYCIVVNIVENIAFWEHRKCISKVSERINALTPREAEVLRLAIEGLPNNAISEKLCISLETVKSHRKRIVSKVGVKRVNDLKHMLFKTNIVQEIIF